jgi:hypothetical protein
MRLVANDKIYVFHLLQTDCYLQIMQCLYFSACLGEDTVRAVAGGRQPLLKRWQSLRETLFHALILPIGLVSTMLFLLLSSFIHYSARFLGHILSDLGHEIPFGGSQFRY